jgi:hypothetical protein
LAALHIGCHSGLKTLEFSGGGFGTFSGGCQAARVMDAFFKQKYWNSQRKYFLCL